MNKYYIEYHFAAPNRRFCQQNQNNRQENQEDTRKNVEQPREHLEQNLKKNLEQLAVIFFILYIVQSPSPSNKDEHR